MRQTQNTQKKDNRKSIFVIALLLLLVAVIGFGGYTLSKYVTKKSETGSASVAKWGYTITSDTTNLFGANYKYDNDKSTTVIATATDANLTVKASDDPQSNRVAPGTHGSMTFTIGGNAEVLAQLNVSMTDVQDVKLTYTQKGVDGEKEHTPVKWTLTFKNTENTTTTPVSEGSLADIEKYFKDNAKNVTVKPGDTASINGTYTISWVWDFENKTPDATSEQKEETDSLDTLLGMVANAGKDHTAVKNGDYTEVIGTGKTNTTVAFKLEISIVQLQK